MSESIGHKATTGAVWATIDKFGSMILQFIVNLILTRLLVPSDFGIIGMLAMFIAVSQTLLDGGFGSALIQKKLPTQSDYSTILYWNILFSSILYLILYLLSPPIAKFYSLPILCDVLRVIGLTLIIGAVTTIQKTRLQKTLAFKTIAITNIVSYVVGASIAIILAFNDFGVWSLVMMQICSGITSIILLYVISGWLPSICFSKSTMKELFGFGGYILAANILQNICQNLQGIIIGKKFSATQMGYYSQAYKLDQITSFSIPQVLVQVMYPVYSSLQDENERLKEVVLMNIRVITYLIFPVLTVLIMTATPLIEWLYGSEWLESAPYFKILCIGGFFVCLQNINFYAVAAKGKSKVLFVWSFYKWGFLLLALLTGMNFGMYGILWGMVLSAINIFLTNAILSSKYVGIELKNQLKEVLKILSICLILLYINKALCFFDIFKILSPILFCLAYLLITLPTKNRKETYLILKKLIERH